MRRFTDAGWFAAGIAALIFAAGVAAGMGVQRAWARVAQYFTTPETAGRSLPLPYGLPVDLAGKLSLYVLAGQSNMSGYGPLDEVEITDPRILAFSNDYRWRVAREPLDNDFGQVDTISRDGAAGVGPGLAFANALLARRPDLRIGLIPCAKGASSIAQWRRSMSDQSLYGSCMKRIRAASTAGSLAGILFFQGEADALDPQQDPGRRPAGPSYGEAFSQFVTEFRKDAGDPDLPFVFAQLGTQTAPDAFIHWDTIKAQQRSVSFSCSAMIVTDDLPLLDGLHFTTASYRLIGERFAEAFGRMLSEEPDCSAARPLT